MTFSFYSNGIQFAGSSSGSNYVTLDGVQTLTNKTIDADDNTILNLTINNFKEGDVRETVRKTEEASNEKLVTERAVSLAVDTYVHEQSIASNVWEVEHNLGRFPSVTVIDSAGTQFISQVIYNSANKLTIYINGSTTGKAYLN